MVLTDLLFLLISTQHYNRSPLKSFTPRGLSMFITVHNMPHFRSQIIQITRPTRRKCSTPAITGISMSQTPTTTPLKTLMLNTLDALQDSRNHYITRTSAPNIFPAVLCTAPCFSNRSSNNLLSFDRCKNLIVKGYCRVPLVATNN